MNSLTNSEGLFYLEGVSQGIKVPINPIRIAAVEGVCLPPSELPDKSA